MWGNCVWLGEERGEGGGGLVGPGNYPRGPTKM